MNKRFAPDIAALFDASNDISLFVWEHAPRWPVLHCTNNVSELVGYSKAEFESRAVSFIDTLHPEDTRRVAEEVENGINDPQAISFTHEDYRLITKQGHTVWVADTTVIERDEDGTARYLIGYLQNISARKNLELALMAERRHLQMVLEGTRLGSWDWNPQTNALVVNQRWLSMYGYESNEHEISMQFWESLLHPDDRYDWHKALQMHLFADTPFYEHVYRVRHARGHYIHVLDRGKVVEWDTSRRALRFAGTHTDISKQKQAELEAREAARSRTVFMANMSHEIRTPLHGILGLASVLASTQLDSYQRELLNTMQESGEYLLTTLNDAIDISRADQGKLSIKIQSHESHALVTHLQALFNEQAKRKGIEYRVSGTESLPSFLAIDKSRLLQIAVNLVNNAFKFTKIGFIRVQLNWADDLLHLQVADSGVGIEDTERVWHVFEQESEESMYPKPGGGLGLGIVRSLVNLMGGQASVDSVPGQGSIFDIRIPARAASAPQKTASLVHRLPVYRVLVIDDNDVNQLILGEMLSKLDQVYVAASSAELGLEVLRQQEFDVVFMDIHMPELDGVEATRRLRAETLSQPYIIGLTANAMPNMRQRAMDAGMNAYLTKPFQLTDIQAVLRDVNELSIRKNT